MDWESEALSAMENVPRFIRKFARRKVEETVASAGRKVVTLADVEVARRKFRSGKGVGSAASAGLDEAEIHDLEERVAALENLPAMQTRYYLLRQCGAAAGCPRARVDVSVLSERLLRVLESSGLDRHLQERIRGPILTHHKFRVAVCGCPNACSQPQIVDFGVIGRVRPERSEQECSKCMACVRICSEKAIEIIGDGPHIDRLTCINCGDCVDVCPTETLVFGARGYSVLVGGRLGRHPRLAETIADFVSEDQVVEMLHSFLEFYLANAQGAEKFSALIERMGVWEVKRQK